MRIRSRVLRRGIGTAAAVGAMLIGFSVIAVEARGQTVGFDGGTLFRTYCASCHGPGGSGDGPVAQHLRKPPADLTRIAVRNGGVFAADKVAQAIDGRNVVRPHGPSDMPVWGDAFSRVSTANDEEAVRQRIEALVRYIEKLQERSAGK
jgi:mono/diheme cytochrome c family protein